MNSLTPNEELSEKLTLKQSQLQQTKGELDLAKDEKARKRLINLKELYEEEIDELQEKLKKNQS